VSRCRPIGIGEIARGIIGKAILATIADDIQEAASFQQICAGQQAGCKAAVHAMRGIFDDSITQGIILVDASNALNNLNRQVALHNIQSRCPSLVQHIRMKSRPVHQWRKHHGCASEKGASSWLSTLPIAEHGFALLKGAFRDALCMRYDGT